MAVVDKRADGAGVNRQYGISINGVTVNKIVKLLPLVTGDSDTSKYLIARLPVKARLLSLKIENTALASGTDFDVGLYDSNENGKAGAVIVKDCFANGLDLSSAHGVGAGLNAMSAIGVGDRAKRIKDFVDAVTSPDAPYGENYTVDLMLTANTIGTIEAADYVAVELEYADAGV